MRLTRTSAFLTCLTLAFMVLTTDGISAQAMDAKFEAQLIWATHDRTSPNPNHKAVEAEIREKLAKLHLKWEHYFAVNKVAFDISKSGTNQAVMSPKCTLEVRLLDANKVEVTLLDKKGDRSCKQIQPLPKGEILVFGGNAPDATAWLVTLKRIE